jgi:hypothetical protein
MLRQQAIKLNCMTKQNKSGTKTALGVTAREQVIPPHNAVLTERKSIKPLEQNVERNTNTLGMKSQI